MKVDLVELIRRQSADRVLWNVKRDTGSTGGSDRHFETLLWSDPDGCLTVSGVNGGSGDHFRFRQDDRFSVDLLPDGHLLVNKEGEVSSQTIDHFIADQVIPRAMAGEGQYLLHSAAIRHTDRAILFLGASGRGKSTLATSFHFAGHDIIGDDAVVVSWRGEVPFANAVYRSLRLFPDSIEALLPVETETDPVADYTPKRRVSVPESKGKLTDALPIAAIFMIAKPGETNPPEARELSTGEACMALIENAFALDPTDTGRARERLEKASALARSVPSFVIDYPRDFASLPAVRAAIIARLD